MSNLKIKKAYDQLFAENKHLRAQLKCKDETIEMLRKLSNVFESSNKSIKLLLLLLILYLFLV